jgi:glutathione synthase/RimK-type ligase-like ATP-grasp enzyme
MYPKAQHDVPYLFQRYVKESHGRDLRVIIVDKEPVFAILRQASSDSLKANLSAGGCGQIVTGMYPKTEAMAIRICEVLEMDMAGFDLLFSDEHGFVCCEVNNYPGMGSDIHKGNHVEDKVADMLVRKL